MSISNDFDVQHLVEGARSHSILLSSAGSTRRQASRSSWDFPFISEANPPPRFANNLVNASTPPLLATSYKYVGKTSSLHNLEKPRWEKQAHHTTCKSLVKPWLANCPCDVYVSLLFSRQRYQAGSSPVKWHCVSHILLIRASPEVLLGFPLEIPRSC